MNEQAPLLPVTATPPRRKNWVALIAAAAVVVMGDVANEMSRFILAPLRVRQHEARDHRQLDPRRIIRLGGL